MRNINTENCSSGGASRLCGILPKAAATGQSGWAEGPPAVLPQGRSPCQVSALSVKVTPSRGPSGSSSPTQGTAD